MPAAEGGRRHQHRPVRPEPARGFRTLYGSPVEGSTSVSVVIGPARPRSSPKLPSARALADIPGEFGISPFTDHLKSLYTKVGVTSRRSSSPL